MHHTQFCGTNQNVWYVSFKNLEYSKQVIFCDDCFDNYVVVLCVESEELNCTCALFLEKEWKEANCAFNVIRTRTCRNIVKFCVFKHLKPPWTHSFHSLYRRIKPLTFSTYSLSFVTVNQWGISRQEYLLNYPLWFSLSPLHSTSLSLPLGSSSISLFSFPHFPAQDTDWLELVSLLIVMVFQISFFLPHRPVSLSPGLRTGTGNHSEWFRRTSGWLYISWTCSSIAGMSGDGAIWLCSSVWCWVNSVMRRTLLSLVFTVLSFLEFNYQIYCWI